MEIMRMNRDKVSVEESAEGFFLCYPSVYKPHLGDTLCPRSMKCSRLKAHQCA